MKWHLACHVAIRFMESNARFDRCFDTRGEGVGGLKIGKVLFGGVPAEDVVQKGIRLVREKAGE